MDPITFKQGLNKILNTVERRLQRTRLASRPLVVDVVVTKACNLACAFCEDYEFEAQACGLPIVATDVNGSGEAISSRHLGRLVPRSDSVAMADAIDDVLSHTWDRHRLRAHALQRTWDHVAEDTFEVFEEALLERAGVG